MPRVIPPSRPPHLPTHLPLLAGWMATFILGAVLAGCGAQPAGTTASKAVPALTVTASHPETATWPQVIAADGDIVAWQEQVVAAQTGGLQITQVLAEVGDTVVPGQVLATLDQRQVLIDLHQAEAAVAEVQANLRLASADAERTRSPSGSEILNGQQRIQYEAAELVAKARLAAAEARLAGERLRLEQTEIKALDGGTVLARPALAGAVVQAGSELFRILRQGRCEWRAEIAAADLVRVKPGDAARIRLAEGGEIAGTIRLIAPALDPAKRMGTALISLTNAGLRPGMFVRGELVLGAGQPLLTVPQDAVVMRDGRSLVFTVDADRRVHEQRVTVRQRQGGRVAVAAEAGPAGAPALETTSLVVVGGGAFLVDGDLVALAPVAPPASAAEAAPSTTPAPGPTRP